MAVGSRRSKSQRPTSTETNSGVSNGAAGRVAGASASSASPRPHNPMLDPHGIYGTRTAYRVRAARRRRVSQNLVIGFAFVALVMALVMYRRVPHTKTIGSDWQTHLMTNLLAMPVAVSTKAGGVLLVPTESGNLIAVDAVRGTVQPGFATAFPLRAQPLVLGNIAWVPCQDGALYAVDWRTGQVLWSHATTAAMSTRPAYTRIFLPSATTPTPVPGATPGANAPPAVGVSPATAPITTGSGMNSAASTPMPVSTPAPPKPVPIVIAGNDEGVVTAMNANNGRVLWHRTATGPVGNGLTTTRGATGQPLVLVPLLGGVAARGGLWCLDARTGAPVWRFPQESKSFAAQLPAPVVDGVAGQPTTRAFCVDDSGAVVCLDLKTGQKIWKTFAQPLSGGHGNASVLLRGEPMFKAYSWGERLIMGGSDGAVRSLDAHDGRLVWAFNAEAPVRCRPQAVRLNSSYGQRDIILSGCDDAALYALDAQTGALLWKYKTSSPAYAGAVVMNQHIIAVSADGSIQSFALPS